MAFGKGFFKKLFSRTEEDDFFSDYEIDVDEQSETLNWNWDNLIKDRHLLKLSDDAQREKYIRSLVEQVKNASEQIDSFSAEYNVVTDTLKDMDELEALPKAELEDLRETAQNLLDIEKERNYYKETKHLMTENQFKAMERFSSSMPKAYDDLLKAEEQRKFIKDDLKKLEDEREGFLYRNAELKGSMENGRGMIMICMFAAVLCVIMLLVLQYGFEMDTKIGYMVTALAVAVVVVIIYVRYIDNRDELVRVNRAINRIILLQNTIKIRYVNNRNLLDYLYMKYDTTSAKELKKVWEAYESEKELRQKNAENEMQLTAMQAEYKKKLSKYHLNDVQTWIFNPSAVMDHKEMVEIRHSHILRRQKLRARLNYNKKLAKEGQQELKQLIKEYPQYGKEVMEMLERYS